MSEGGVQTIPARRGKAVRLGKGQRIKVINTHGSQVVDTWCLNADDITEFMSMEHTRPMIGRIIPKPGDTLTTNRRRPILTLEEDTSPGIHDTLVAACDRWRYELLGCAEYHDNCQDNFSAGLSELGIKPVEVPSPFNLWMNIPVEPDRSISFQAPVSRPGDFVVLRAEMDCIVVFSACPQDIVPVNGDQLTPVDAHYEVLG